MAIANLDIHDLRSDAANRGRARYGGIEEQSSRWAFEAGLPDPATFPIDDLVRLSERVLREDAAHALQYGERHDGIIVYGYDGLRDLLGERAQQTDGRAFDRSSVMLTHGGVQGLTLAIDAFIDPGDAMAAEAATWQTILVAARRAGAQLTPIPVDDDGMVVDYLERELARLRDEGTRLKVVYSCPTFHSPTGTCMSLERRRRLLELADEWDFMVLEDNVYGPLRFEGDPVPSLLSLDTSGRVLKVDAFTKIVAPALRLGWVTGHPSAVESLSAVRGDLGVSQWIARIMAEFIREGLLDPHLAMVNELYGRKRDAAVAALEAHCKPWVEFRVPQGGYFIWLELSERVDWQNVRREAYRRVVECRPGEQFFTEEDLGHQYLRIAFTMVPLEEIERGIAVLGEAIAASVREQ